MTHDSTRKNTKEHKSLLLRVRLWLVLFLWCAYGAATNSANLYAFNLQQAGVEAIVERKQFSIEGSKSPHLQFRAYFHQGMPFGDVFLHEGRHYAAKQPGQFMAGALVYFFLRLLGLNYVNDYLLVSALVTFFTTSLGTALAAGAVFGAARELAGANSFAWPLIAALAYGLATPAFVYSGIAHHDQLASACLVIAFYLVLLLARRRVSGETEKAVALSSGLLLGLTLTTSILPFLMVAVVAGYLISLRRLHLAAFAGLGAVVGIAPMLIYNTVAFGNPFLLPNIAGGYRDTFLLPDPSRWIDHIRFYVGSLALFVPVFFAGGLGWCLLPREQRREQIVTWALALALALHVFNIETDGGCQYGPRYLLPLMPFACLGLIGFQYVRASKVKGLGIAIVLLIALASFVVSLMGAIQGAMYCETEQYALGPYLSALLRNEWRTMPLLKWLIIPVIISSVMLTLTAISHSRRQVSSLR